MEIRLAKNSDMSRLEEIFVSCRAFMAETGNAYQWGHNNWPPLSIIENDIHNGKGFVVIDEGIVIAYFYCSYGENVESCYNDIEGEGWKYDGPYAVIHRIGAIVHGKNILEFVVKEVLKTANHIRIDTHEDNAVMRHQLTKLGFAYRGIVYVEHDAVCRLAYEL